MVNLAIRKMEHVYMDVYQTFKVHYAQNALWVIIMIMDSACPVRAIVRTVHHATRQLGDVITDVLITGAGISVKNVCIPTVKIVT